jgi:hypothetical protein
VKSILAYSPEAGVFIRKVTLSPRFPIGTVAGYKSKDGYWNLTILGKHYRSHRIAWLYVHGEWPKYEIDHKDGNPDNNRLSNLREATRIQNTQNVKIHCDNRSGFKGVRWHPKTKKWQARIYTKGKTTYLGYFHSAEEGSDAYNKKAAELFGEFNREQNL